MQKLVDLIEKLQVDNKNKRINEEATKQSIILPILNNLGWEVFNIEEVSPEYSVDNTRIDYSLRNNSKNKVFIEVKKINEELEKHQEQLLTYSFRQGVHLAILTNGISWWFYLPLQEGSWEQRRFYAIDINAQEAKNISIKFSEFLAKENVINGNAFKNAKTLYGSKQKNSIINETVPKAWRKLHIERDNTFVELLAETTEKLCGYKPNDEFVAKFLDSVITTNIENKHNTKSKQDILTIPKKQEKSDINSEYMLINENFTKLKIDCFKFNNEKYYVNNFKNFMLKILEIIYDKHMNKFDRVLNVKGRSRSYFTKDSSDLKRPEQIKNSEYYVEGNLNANNIMKIIEKILILFDYQTNSIKIKIK